MSPTKSENERGSSDEKTNDFVDSNQEISLSFSKLSHKNNSEGKTHSGLSRRRERVKQRKTSELSDDMLSKIDTENHVKGSGSRLNAIPHSMFVDDEKNQRKFASRLLRLQVPKRRETKRKMPLFSHLVQMERDINMAESIKLSNSPIHPCFVTFGLQCAENLLFSPRVRSVRLINCLKTFVRDYRSPENSDASRDFETRLRASLSFLSECRPNSAGMATVIKFFKMKLTEIISYPEEEMKLNMAEFLDTFLTERVIAAGDILATSISQKVVTDDIVLTYSISEVVAKALIQAWNSGKRFKVVVVDSLPFFEGRSMLKLLAPHGIKCCYINLNATSVVMRNVSKVLLPVNSLLSNGAVLSHIGSALIASVAHYYRVPVLVCCETYKFSDRAQTDAFVYNELGDPDDILDQTHPLALQILDWKKNPRVTLLNLYYDVIQPKYVTAVITELGIIPCTSAPVVFRVKN